MTSMIAGSLPCQSRLRCGVSFGRRRPQAATRIQCLPALTAHEETTAFRLNRGLASADELFGGSRRRSLSDRALGPRRKSAKPI